MSSSKRARSSDDTTDSSPVLGPEFDKIVNDLRNKTGYDKNKYLSGIKSQRLAAMNALSKKIVDVEYEMKKCQLELDELKEQYKLFEFYDDGKDPY